MKPRDIRDLTLILAKESGPTAALNTMLGAIDEMATGRIPDVGDARKALDAWGVSYKSGTPINQLFSTTPSLDVQLPPGWSLTSKGIRHWLVDDRGASRLLWSIAPIDRIYLQVLDRYTYPRPQRYSPTEAVVQVKDGEMVLHTVPVLYPFPLVAERLSDGSLFYCLGGDEEGWSKSMRLAINAIDEEAQDDARTWLDFHCPNRSDAIACWAPAWSD